jgi:hypothetical protein
MDFGNIESFVKEKPYLAGGVGLAVAGIVGYGIWSSRRSTASGGTPSGYISDSTDVGRPVVVESTNYVPPIPPVTTPATPAPATKPVTGKIYAGDPAILPKNKKCPGGSSPVYARRAGTYGQTTGEIMCEFHDGRQLPPNVVKK